MRRLRSLYSVTARPSPAAALVLAVLPFLLVFGGDLVAAEIRHAANPRDKIMPTLAKMIDGFREAAFEPDPGNRDEPAADLGGLPAWRRAFVKVKQSGVARSQLLNDTLVSGRRFVISVALLSVAVLVGLHMGCLRYVEAGLLRFILLLDKIPAVALLPILFLVFGVDEASKIVFAFIGVFPTVALDTYQQVKAVPQEQVTKALTLAASDFEVAYHMILPKIMPKVLNTIRLNFKAIIGFLIFAETIAASEGLGYRIFQSMRYLKMSTILPYVAWISLLAFLADFGLRLWISKMYPWADRD